MDDNAEPIWMYDTYVLCTPHRKHADVEWLSQATQHAPRTQSFWQAAVHHMSHATVAHVNIATGVEGATNTQHAVP